MMTTFNKIFKIIGFILLFASLAFFTLGFVTIYLYTLNVAAIVCELLVGLICLVASIAMLSHTKIETVTRVNNIYEAEYKQPDCYHTSYWIDEEDEEDWDEEEDEDYWDEEEERRQKEEEEYYHSHTDDDVEEYEMYEDDY